MVDHLEEHPEPVEGCRACALTPRPAPPRPSIEELLSRALLRRDVSAPPDIVDRNTNEE